jgi:hypothetical protein
VENKPVVNVDFELFGHNLKELFLDLVDIFAHGKLGAIGNAINVGVYRDSDPTKRQIIWLKR